MQRLLAGLATEIGGAAIAQLERYVAEMQRWNVHVNLTAITETGEIAEKHIYDSLTVLPLLRGARTLLDIGSGAGLPGIPLSIVAPELQIDSIDAVAKKIMFQRHIARMLNLQNFHPLHMRAEDLPVTGKRYDVIVSRAFSALADFVQVAAPVLAEGGKIIAMKGPEGVKELSSADQLLSGLGLQHRDVENLMLPRTGAQRTLIVLQR